MAEKQIRYPTVLFDWGDTVMRDYPEITIPMVEWEKIEVLEGIPDVLEYLNSTGRRIVLATSASISDEGQIWRALARGSLDAYFSRIYCFKNTNLPKGEEFYRHILKDLGVSATNVLMVGDGFEKDVEVPNKLGMFAVWFNPRSGATRRGNLRTTVHAMQDLLIFFKSLDQTSKSVIPPMS